MQDKTHKNLSSLRVERTVAAVSADPTLSNLFFFADSYNYHANTTGNATTGSRWRKTPAGGLGKKEAVGIITTVMDYTTQGDY